MALLDGLVCTQDGIDRKGAPRRCHRNVSSRLRAGARVVVCIFAFLAPAYAQSAAAGGNESAPAANSQSSTNANADTVKAAEEALENVRGLAASYEQQAERLAEQNARLKELYEDGIISRREMEQSDKALAEARARAEAAREDVKKADSAVEAAKSPQLIITDEKGVVSALGDRVIAWTTGSASIDALIRKYGGEYGVDPYLIYLVMAQESGFRPRATSQKGAMGLMQLIPATAARFGVTEPYDPEQSIMGGTRYLKFLLDLFEGRVDLALAAYNAGEGAVKKYGNRIPPYSETRNYVRTISARYVKGTV